MNDIERDGTLNILNTNTPSEATHNQIYFGNNNYVITEEFYIDPKTKEKIITYRAFHKTINVYNNDLLTDSIIWVHEISPLQKSTSRKKR